VDSWDQLAAGQRWPSLGGPASSWPLAGPAGQAADPWPAAGPSCLPSELTRNALFTVYKNLVLWEPMWESVGPAKLEQEWPEMGLAELHTLNFPAYVAFLMCIIDIFCSICKYMNMHV
jgi:hypothetical protein